MELGYIEYLKHVGELLEDENIKATAKDSGPLGKFVLEDRKWEPVRYPGYTLITPTFADDPDNVCSFETLLEVKKTLSEHMNFLKCVEAPDNALHMTIARLISGNAYEKITSDDFEKILLGRFSELVFNSSCLRRPQVYHKRRRHPSAGSGGRHGCPCE